MFSYKGKSSKVQPKSANAFFQRAEEFIAIVDLEMNPKLVTAEDNNASYFVRCPILSTNAQQPAIVDERNATGANFSSTDAAMRQLTEIGPSLKLITLDGQGVGQQGVKRGSI